MRVSGILRSIARCLGLLPVLLLAQSPTPSEGDAYRGAAVLEKESCTQCHAIRGQGGKTGPDLGTRTSRQYTPAVMASVMWNHAPAMWSAMKTKGIATPAMGDQEAADLFAYFYSVRFFDKPGEAERGKRLFAAKHCAECHSTGGEGKGPGNPVQNWTAMGDPVILVEQMWNHSSLMKHAFEAKKLGWVSLSGQDLVDLTAYLQDLPSMRKKASTFWLSGPQGGEVLFQEKGCGACHTGALALEGKLANQTLPDIAAAMWNHGPKLTTAPAISTDEMRQIVSYVWEKQYLGSAGSSDRGGQVFKAKHCATCHTGDGGAPHLRDNAKTYSPVTMVAVLWKHGPAMLERMQERKMPWPRLTPAELSDLVAYLNTKP